MLRNRQHGAEILDVRKALAFAGFTHRSPRAISYVQANRAFDPRPDTYGQAGEHKHEHLLTGTSTYSGGTRGRAMSL